MQYTSGHVQWATVAQQHTRAMRKSNWKHRFVLPKQSQKEKKKIETKWDQNGFISAVLRIDKWRSQLIFLTLLILWIVRKESERESRCAGGKNLKENLFSTCIKAVISILVVGNVMTAPFQHFTRTIFSFSLSRFGAHSKRLFANERMVFVCAMRVYLRMYGGSVRIIMKTARF